MQATIVPGEPCAVPQVNNVASLFGWGCMMMYQTVIDACDSIWGRTYICLSRVESAAILLAVSRVFGTCGHVRL